MKMVVIEGIWEDIVDLVLWMMIVKINLEEKKNEWEVNVLYVLSFLFYGILIGSVEGMNML